MQHQSRMAAKRQEQQRHAAHRAHAAAVRQAEQIQRQQERARSAAARASAAEQKEAEREAKRLHEEAMQAEVDERNARLAATYEDIDTLLAATLDVDDYVDLETLRVRAEHPPFPRPDLELPLPPPAPLQAPPEPQYVEPPKASGLRGMFGGAKHAEAVAQAQAAHAQAHGWWRQQVADLPAAQMRQIQEHQAAEQQRLAQLEQARAAYNAECQQREAEAAQANAQLDALLAGLAAGDEAAVQEYVGIVLSNSVYPDEFPVEHDFEYDSALKELSLTAYVPGPEAIPAEKEWKYVRSKDEITPTALSQKAQKDRYTNAVAQVALRTLHEVFEADRAGWIQSIALTVATEALDTATGLMKETPLAAVAADRSFAEFDLSNVVPLDTLNHLGALVSKNPFGLAPIDTSKGVRGTK